MDKISLLSHSQFIHLNLFRSPLYLTSSKVEVQDFVLRYERSLIYFTPFLLLHVLAEKFIQFEPKSLTYLESSSLQMAQWHLTIFLNLTGT